MDDIYCIVFGHIYCFVQFVAFKQTGKKIVEPFDKLKFNSKEFVYDELKPFANTITEQQKKIKNNLKIYRNSVTE